MPSALRASLADQAGRSEDAGMAVALGANLGDPLATLLAVRPLLADLLQSAIVPPPRRLRWSPLFRTEPVGGPAGQPAYLNAVLWVEPSGTLAPDPAAAGGLLAGLQGLEQRFGRQRLEPWGPRSLDLDLLWWGGLRLATPALTLPHPRLAERSFVLAPLAAIDPLVIPPGQTQGCAARLKALLPQLEQAPPERLSGRPGWPE